MEEKNKHYWLKEIAYAFNMTVYKFAEMIGYSRQTLYCASRGTLRLGGGHLHLVIFKLNRISEQILESDIESAKERFEYRRKLIDDFAKRFNAEDV